MRASFRAGYARVFRACYAVVLDVSREAERWTFHGTVDIGILAGGVYGYAGEATPPGFVCRYRTGGDPGEFRLTPLSKGRRQG